MGLLEFDESLELSVIVPCHNEAENVEPLFAAIVDAFAEKLNGSYQVVFVDDGSSDSTLDLLRRVAESKPSSAEVTIVSFSRNFGKEAALYAGLEHARGQFVAFIDADLQQSPETLMEMYELLLSHDDVDCVAAYQESRGSGILRNAFSRCFYGILAKSSRMDIIPNASDFRVFRRSVAQALLTMGEYHRFTKGLFAWVGFSTLPFPYIPADRNAGETSWSFSSLVRYALEGLLSFSTFPLTIASYLGCITSGVSMIYLIVVVAKRLLWGVDIPGFATLAALILLFGGLQLLVMGIMGSYLARMYIQGKQRPIYLAKLVEEHKATLDGEPIAS